MDFLDKLERKLGKFAIPHLTSIIAILAGVVYILNMASNGKYMAMIALIPSKVFEGEVWRLVTFAFSTYSNEVIWVIFELYFFYFVGSVLENHLGTFKLNCYYFVGLIPIIIASLVMSQTGVVRYLNLSLFLAFARLFPDYEIMLFFVLPVKVKYLAYIEWAIFAFYIIVMPFGTGVFVILSIINYFLFFGKDIIRGAKYKGNNYVNKVQYEKVQKKPRHSCHVCNKTEFDDRSLEFRYCEECKGDYEYCMEHLKNHEHIKGDKI